jgi:hypothetical protein
MALPPCERRRSSFAERFQEMLYICGPQSWSTLLASEAEIQSAREILSSSTADALHKQDAARLCAAALNPDTGLPIPVPFRMAAHVPVNTMLLIGMMSARTPLANGFWQFANQSFNALQFFANRNASNKVSVTNVLCSYLGAVVSSVGASVLLSRVLQTSPSWLAPGARNASLLLVPFLGAVAGKPLQIGLMRRDELSYGVHVFNDSGDLLGLSVKAGQAAVAMTIFVRTIYLAPMIYIPFLFEWMKSHSPLLRTSKIASAGTYVAITAASSTLFTPACMAIFDQRSSLPVQEVEPEIQQAWRMTTHSMDRVYFNKGL